MARRDIATVTSLAAGNRVTSANIGVRTDEQVLATYVDRSAPRALREAAFHVLVDRYHRRLFSVCLRILRSQQDAEDAVQETFVRLARKAEEFRGDAALSTWLYRVAHNVCTDHVRYDARRPATPVDDIVVLAGARAGDDEFAAHDTADHIKHALDQLDEQSRMLLLLVAIDGLSYDQAAEATGLAVGTVKSKISRARLKLGKLLSEKQGDPPATDRTLVQPPRAKLSSDADERGPPD
ncbi:MAG: RNA polymerase sigma factor [Nitriliruptoraceae bacterium]